MPARTFTSRDLPGPENILRRELSNGSLVLARQNRHSPSVTISGYLPAGSLLDEDQTLGLADFTASALMRGTQTQSAARLYENLEEVGAGLGFSGGTHTTSFTGRCLVEDLPMLLSSLANVLRTPIFPGKEVEKLRAAVLTSLDLQMQDSQDRAGIAFDQVVYPNHPYGRPDEGWPETVRRIRRSDLQSFHRKHYGPRGLVLAIVGGIEPEEAARLGETSLGDWHNPDQSPLPELPKWEPLSARQEVRIPMPGKRQADLMIGTAGPPRQAEDFLSASIGNHILGTFGLMGRLGESLRENAGLAYYVYSNLGSSPGPGAWLAAAGVDPKDVSRAIDLILAELKRFVSEPVSAEELSDVQSNLIGSQPLSLESNIGVASLLLHLERHSLGLDYLQRYPALVNSVTPEEILAAAARYLQTDRLAVVAAGKLEDNRDG